MNNCNDPSCITCPTDKDICTVCKDKYALDDDGICRFCTDNPNCNGCFLIGTDQSCQFCLPPFTGWKCDTACPHGQKQFNVIACQATSCSEAAPCNGIGACKFNSKWDFACPCVELNVDFNCVALPACTVYNCRECRKADKTTCEICHDGYFQYKKKCVPCSETNCKECGVDLALNFRCTACQVPRKGYKCDTTCALGFKQLNIDECQPITGTEFGPCNLKGSITRAPTGTVCQCIRGYSGVNCENFFTCDVSNCVTCSAVDFCGTCENGYSIRKGYCDRCDQPQQLLTISGKCGACGFVPNCKYCDDGEVDKCAVCINGLSIINGDCENINKLTSKDIKSLTIGFLLCFLISLVGAGIIITLYWKQRREKYYKLENYIIDQNFNTKSRFQLANNSKVVQLKNRQEKILQGNENQIENMLETPALSGEIQIDLSDNTINDKVQ
ncbi:Cysteine-rich membrane protein 2 [Spironucleus salmonicida]|uniref:Cysteine-rich membrane protein 2 n=1 Tax=Spironucleus salmonicida TaxID=348837 RepID=V6LE78_9EUKA|nr:Cysteine-rich membrane protein 2 [Spironucleus salmonicida]|eukprot:EST42777.1 Cysteine-rich membrane protein 2 [Spironucleus salmonicida]